MSYREILGTRKLKRGGGVITWPKWLSYYLFSFSFSFLFKSADM